MQNRPYFLLLYGCSISGNQQFDWMKVFDAARQINDAVPQEQQIHLLGNFDNMRRYIGVPLATSNKRLASDLKLPLMPTYFTLSLDGITAWLDRLIEPDRLHLAEAQWSRIRSAGRSMLSPDRPSDVPLGHTLLVHDIDERRRYGGDIHRLST
jgi:hypothetical protein